MAVIAQIPGSIPQSTKEHPPQPAGPCVMVIFGASGDLTKRKLIPSLYNLQRSHHLPDKFAVLGFALDQLSTDQFRDNLSQAARELSEVPVEDTSWNEFIRRVYYMQGNFDDDAAFGRLRDQIEKIGCDHETGGNVLFYLATSPSFFATVVGHLGKAQMVNESDGKWRRVVIEKPFGHDLQSSVDLDHQISQTLHEDQIYRIDHYLGKETVQNMLIFRFSNGIFEPIWNRRYIDHVQITVAETVGVEQRGAYYEHAGTARCGIWRRIIFCNWFRSLA